VWWHKPAVASKGRAQAAYQRLDPPLRKEKRKNLLFLKKKKQKDFYVFAASPSVMVARTIAATAPGIKVFLLLFLQKKKNPVFLPKKRSHRVAAPCLTHLFCRPTRSACSMPGFWRRRGLS
jgi:hypothetical protein